MPGPTDRLVVDPDGLRLLITAAVALRETLRHQARLLAAQLDAVPITAAAPSRLRAVAAWADGEVGMLRRRLILAEAADPGSGRPLLTRGVPDVYLSADQARAGGQALADRLLRPDPDRRDRTRLADLAAQLGPRVDDPDFVAGFYDRLGPSGLAALLHQVHGVPAGRLPRTPARTPAPPSRADGTADAAGGGSRLERILGRSLAAYSRLRDLAGSWLARFDSRGRPGTAETFLLGPLLAHGRFATALLARLGALLFDEDDGRVREVGPPARPKAAAGDGDLLTAAGYAGALLRAIAADGRLAPTFAAEHLPQLLHASQLSRPDLPAGLLPTGGWRDRDLEAARAGLVAAAGGPAARRAHPAAARAFVVRLADVVGHAGSGPVSPAMQAAYGRVLHTWRDDLYASVVSLLPPDPRDPGAPGLGLSAGQWAAVLRESLRGGASAPLLAADAVAFGERLDQDAWERTRGYNSGAGGYYPASPRALAHLQADEVTAFFGAALTDAAETVLRDHAAGLEAHRRRAAIVIDLLSEVAKSIDVTNPVGSLSRLAIGVSVEMIEARVRHATADVPTAGARAALDDLREGRREIPGWQARYRASAGEVWARRHSDPLRPVLVRAADGATRVYTGDPRADGFVTGRADDFLGPDGEPVAPEAMSRAQLSAYAAWLASPAIVANNDRIPAAPATPPADPVPGWGPGWTRDGQPPPDPPA